MGRLRVYGIVLQGKGCILRCKEAKRRFLCVRVDVCGFSNEYDAAVYVGAGTRSFRFCADSMARRDFVVVPLCCCSCFLLRRFAYRAGGVLFFFFSCSFAFNESKTKCIPSIFLAFCVFLLRGRNDACASVIRVYGVTLRLKRSRRVFLFSFCTLYCSSGSFFNGHCSLVLVQWSQIRLPYFTCYDYSCLYLQMSSLFFSPFLSAETHVLKSPTIRRVLPLPWELHCRLVSFASVMFHSRKHFFPLRKATFLCVWICKFDQVLISSDSLTAACTNVAYTAFLWYDWLRRHLRMRLPFSQVGFCVLFAMLFFFFLAACHLLLSSCGVSFLSPSITLLFLFSLATPHFYTQKH